MRHLLPHWRKSHPLPQNGLGRAVSVTVPARFDFIGGWTDTPPYYFDNPAAVLNGVLRLRQFGSSGAFVTPIRIRVSPAQKFSYCVNGEKMDRILPDDGVAQGVFYFLDLHRPSVEISIENAIPRGSGLGGSSLLSLGLLTALRAYWEGALKAIASPREMINDVLMIEQLIGSGGGWQDQIGGLLPGIKLIQTLPGQEQYRVSFLPQEATSALQDRTLMVDTRQSRKAVIILSSIREKYINREPETVATLAAIRNNAKEGFLALARKDIRAFSALMHSSWGQVCAVESAISSFLPNTLSTMAGISGYKLGGAGGGGFLMIVADSQESRARIAEDLHKIFPQCLLFEPDFTGSGLEVEQGGQTFSVPVESKEILV